MALYEVTLRQRYFQQLVINTFSYATLPGIGVTPSALELLTEMGLIAAGDPLEFPADTFAAQLQSIQNGSVEFLAAEARELYSLTDFYEAVYSPPIEGTWAAVSAESPLVAYGFYTDRVRLDIRRGTKRFVGVTEDAVDPGGNVSVAMLDFLADVAEKMSEVLVGTTAAYAPAVISRERVVDPETERVTYQLYATEAEQEEHTAVGVTWTPYTTVRSQTSRQYGRGI
jgi:hypothetical protein